MNFGRKSGNKFQVFLKLMERMAYFSGNWSSRCDLPIALDSDALADTDINTCYSYILINVTDLLRL